MMCNSWESESGRERKAVDDESKKIIEPYRIQISFHSIFLLLSLPHRNSKERKRFYHSDSNVEILFLLKCLKSHFTLFRLWFMLWKHCEANSTFFLMLHICRRWWYSLTAHWRIRNGWVLHSDAMVAQEPWWFNYIAEGSGISHRGVDGLPWGSQLDSSSHHLSSSSSTACHCTRLARAQVA